MRTVVHEVKLKKESMLWELAKIANVLNEPILGFTYYPSTNVQGVKTPEAFADESAKIAWRSVALSSCLATWSEVTRRYPNMLPSVALRQTLKEEVENRLVTVLVRMFEYVDVHELIHAHTDEPDEWRKSDMENKREEGFTSELRTYEKTDEMMKHAKRVVMVII